MLYAAKIDDRHLSEQKLLEMAAFYTWLDFTLTVRLFTAALQQLLQPLTAPENIQISF